MSAKTDGILSCVAYDASSPTGLIWITNPGRQKLSGKPAGSINIKKYYRVAYERKLYQAHRIVWELHHGPIPTGKRIDHINRNPQDNRIENLRLATAAQNGHNRKVNANSKTGIKGLTRRNDGGWVGRIWRQGKRISMSSLDRKEVEMWLMDMRPKLHKEFASYGT